MKVPWAVSLWHKRAGVATCCDHLTWSVTWSDQSDGRNNTRSRGGGQLYSLARSGNTRLWLNLTIRNIDMWVAVSASQLLSVVFLSHFHLPSLSSALRLPIVQEMSILISLDTGMETIINNFLPVRTRDSDSPFVAIIKVSCWWKFFKEIITMLDNLFSNYKVLLINKI